MIVAFLAAVAVARVQSSWQVPVEVGSIQISPTGKYAAIYSQRGTESCIANLHDHSSIRLPGRGIRFSADDKYALYSASMSGPAKIIDLQKTTKLDLPGKPVFALFDPNGHDIALQTQDEPQTITVYELDSLKSRKLSKFMSDIPLNTMTKQPIRIHLHDWTTDGIIVGGSMSPMNAGDSLFAVDPVKDRATADLHGSAYDSPYRLPDGTGIGMTGSGPNDGAIGLFSNEKLVRKLFTNREAGSDYPNFDVAGVAANSNVFLITGWNRGASKSVLWAMNAVTGKFAVLAKAHWPVGGVHFGFPTAISPDGKWVLYCSPHDDQVLSLMKVPRAISVVNLSQSQKES